MLPPAEWRFYLLALLLTTSGICCLKLDIYFATQQQQRQTDEASVSLLSFWATNNYWRSLIVRTLDNVYAWLVITVAVIRIPQVTPPISHDDFPELLLFAPFLLFFVALAHVYLEPSRNFFYAGNLLIVISMVFMDVHEYYAQCAYMFAEMVLVEQLAMSNNRNLWGAFVLQVQQPDVSVLCLPKLNDVRVLPREAVDLVLYAWAPVAFLDNLRQCPAWVLSAISKKVVTPG